MSSGKVLLGILVGATAGALTGILLAPHKGAVTRKKIMRKTGAFTHSIKEKFDELLEHITEKLDQAKVEVTGFAEKKMAKSKDTKDAKTL